MLGGIEGSGNALLSVVAAPVVLFGRAGIRIDPLLVWPAIFIAEAIYFFLPIYLFRIFHFPAIIRNGFNKLLPYLKAKQPPNT